MKDETRAHLHDLVQAVRAIEPFTADCTFETYCGDEMMRSAVERKFEIIGEALARIRRDDPNVLRLIRHHRDIISFRNILAHGYDAIDDRIVWRVIADDLGNPIDDATRLMSA